MVGEPIRRPNRLRRASQRQNHEPEHQQLAHEGKRIKAQTEELLPRLDQGHAKHHARQPYQIELAGEGELGDLGFIAPNILRQFSPVRPQIPEVIDHQQQDAGYGPRLPQTQSPQEIDAQQVAQEQRRIADRKQAPSDIADQKDKEDDRMPNVLTLGVGLKQRPDQQHACTGCADEAGDQRPKRQEGRIGGWMGGQIASQADPPADHIQREQQNDEGNVFSRDRMLKNLRYLVTTERDEVVRERHRRKDQRHHQTVLVAFPPVHDGRQQRKNRNREQQPYKRQERPEAHRVERLIVAGVLLGPVPDGGAVEQHSHSQGSKSNRKPLQAGHFVRLVPMSFRHRCCYFHGFSLQGRLYHKSCG